MVIENRSPIKGHWTLERNEPPSNGARARGSDCRQNERASYLDRTRERETALVPSTRSCCMDRRSKPSRGSPTPTMASWQLPIQECAYRAVGDISLIEFVCSFVSWREQAASHVRVEMNDLVRELALTTLVVERLVVQDIDPLRTHDPSSEIHRRITESSRECVGEIPRRPCQSSRG